MCGINGIYGVEGVSDLAPIISRMNDAIRYRGPDDQGVYVSPQKNCGFGHVRLSIIDLSHNGHQPMSNEDGSVMMVFNGEIYNYQILKAGLLKKGHKFKSNTDSEVIIHLYEEYGAGCVDHLNGMFSFAIWDESKSSIFLARDRIGIKPLYYYYDNVSRRLIFSSDIKPLLESSFVPREIDLTSLDYYLTYRYIPAPSSIVKGVRKLEPASYLIFDGTDLSIKKYWELDASTQDLSNMADEEVKSAFKDLLTDSVKRRMISDVPLGVFLSGGIDSSIVTALMAMSSGQPIKTYSVGFGSESYNELPFARLVADKYKTDHTEISLEPDMHDILFEVMDYLHEPLADISIVPTYLISKVTRENVKVVLGGDGGDELFGGYDHYLAQLYDQQYLSFIPAKMKQLLATSYRCLPSTDKRKGALNQLRKFLFGLSQPNQLKHFRWGINFTQAQKKSLYTDKVKSKISTNPYEPALKYLLKFSSFDDLNQLTASDIKTWMCDDVLRKVDTMSMAHALEVRVPFLDHKVVEFAQNLPGRFKIQGKQRKHLLMELAKDLLPDEITRRRGKHGFSMPVKLWFRNEWMDLLQNYIYKCDDLFDTGYLKSMVDEHVSGRADHTVKLWSILVFCIWKERVFD